MIFLVQFIIIDRNDFLGRSSLLLTEDQAAIFFWKKLYTELTCNQNKKNHDHGNIFKNFSIIINIYFLFIILFIYLFFFDADDACVEYVVPNGRGGGDAQQPLGSGCHLQVPPSMHRSSA